MSISIKDLNEKITSLEKEMQDESAFGFSDKLEQLSQDYHKLTLLRDTTIQLGELESRLKQNEEITDPEMEALLVEDNAQLQEQITKLSKQLKQLTLSPLPDDDKASIIEVRAGTGGTEASLFAEELFRMYTRYCNEHNWKVEAVEINKEETGGIKSAILKINTKGSFGKLRFESGVHRVQRVPVTESSGRIHTSAASVAILPVIDDIKVVIKDDEIRVDIYRSSGPGGQSVNTTDSAVRVTHIPTGITVSCQDGKSQLKNKEKALEILAAKLYSLKLSEHEEKISAQRNLQIKSGDRSEKIRTYNFQQSRVTDHRIKQSWFNIHEILDGALGEVIDEVQDFMRR